MQARERQHGRSDRLSACWSQLSTAAQLQDHAVAAAASILARARRRAARSPTRQPRVGVNLEEVGLIIVHGGALGALPIVLDQPVLQGPRGRRVGDSDVVGSRGGGAGGLPPVG